MKSRTFRLTGLGLCAAFVISLAEAASDTFIADAKTGCKVFKPNTKVDPNFQTVN